jgi:hypothetical protein
MADENTLEAPDPENLTPAQEQMIIDLWNKTPENPPSLKEIMQHVFGAEFDGRSAQARLVQQFLAKRNLKARTLTNYTPIRPAITLNENQQTYVKNNLATMNALEMAKILFSNNNLSNLNSETRAVNEYIKTLNPRALFSEEDINEVPMGDYDPPKTFDATLARINKYILFVEDRKKITPTQKKNVHTLMGYMQTYRFVAQMNTFDTETKRKLAEDAFIRATHDKLDLQQEEVDQYIEYANHVVQGFEIQRRSTRLQNLLETISGNDPDTMKISISLVEAIGKASTELNLCKKREQDLLDGLKQQRSERMSKQISDNATILNLVQLWKQEEERVELIALAEKEQEAIGEEIVKLSSLPDIKARIMGLRKEGIQNG